MRLIDADALLERIMDINSWYLYNEWGSETEFHKLIDEAPTVEPTDTDLISRADAMAEFREWVKRANENGETPTWNDAVSLIGSLPSADAELVVRCKDCKHSFYNKDYESYNCRKHEYVELFDADDYCSWGERND